MDKDGDDRDFSVGIIALWHVVPTFWAVFIWSEGPVYLDCFAALCNMPSGEWVLSTRFRPVLGGDPKRRGSLSDRQWLPSLFGSPLVRELLMFAITG